MGAGESRRLLFSVCEEVLDASRNAPQRFGARLKVHVERQHWVPPGVCLPQSIDRSLIQHFDLLWVDYSRGYPSARRPDRVEIPICGEFFDHRDVTTPEASQRREGMVRSGQLVILASMGHSVEEPVPACS
jgi:hypothetical protein